MDYTDYGNTNIPHSFKLQREINNEQDYGISQIIRGHTCTENISVVNQKFASPWHPLFNHAEETPELKNCLIPSRVFLLAKQKTMVDQERDGKL